MRCPYCEKNMEIGLIQSPHELSWIKGEKRKFFARAIFHEESVVLSELSMNGSACIAYNCSDCEKIVIDYSDENVDKNNR